MARIENHKYSIEEAFKECFYIVPDYQREYVWTEKEVHQLLDDIDEQLDAGSGREYFIGTVLVSPASRKAQYEIIDGQQRLTTLFLLLCALRLHAALVDDIDFSAADVSDRVANSLPACRLATFY